MTTKIIYILIENYIDVKNERFESNVVCARRTWKSVQKTMKSKINEAREKFTKMAHEETAYIENETSEWTICELHNYSNRYELKIFEECIKN